MRKLSLLPHDFLFLRDSRPMGGSSSGHGARIPEPHVLHGALHAACHRAFADEPEIGYRHGYTRRSDGKRTGKDSERFGSLRSVGPFPVDEQDRWFFPKPADLEDPCSEPAVTPLPKFPFPGGSSLPKGLQLLAPQEPPNKSNHPNWMSKTAIESYLRGKAANSSDTRSQDDFFTIEHSIGIGIDPDTGTTSGGQIYSRDQIRLREGCQLGAIVESGNRHQRETDLMDRLLPEDGIIQIGGEGRSCTVTRSECQPADCLPVGPEITGETLKWVLLSPALFPALRESGKDRTPHPGGWLPNWIDPETFEVRLFDGPGPNKARRLGCDPGSPIQAKLIAARIERPLPVSGWTNPGSSDSAEEKSGARSTLLAVPAGSVYYFKADDPTHARNLAKALNWHGASTGDQIYNRRSTLFGEKGYGIGVCGPF